MSETGQLPAGTTIYECPLSACSWTYAQVPLTVEQLAASMDEPVIVTALRQVMPAENAIREHLETHTLLEWTQEIMALRYDLDQLLAVGTMYLEAFSPSELLTLPGKLALQEVEAVIGRRGRRY